MEINSSGFFLYCGYGTYIAIMRILEAVSIGDFFLTEEELITSRMIAQLYKTVKYQCIIVKRPLVL